jgi:hypothetical protein
MYSTDKYRVLIHNSGIHACNGPALKILNTVKVGDSVTEGNALHLDDTPFVYLERILCGTCGSRIVVNIDNVEG